MLSLIQSFIEWLSVTWRGAVLTYVGVVGGYVVKPDTLIYSWYGPTVKTTEVVEKGLNTLEILQCILWIASLVVVVLTVIAWVQKQLTAKTGKDYSVFYLFKKHRKHRKIK